MSRAIGCLLPVLTIIQLVRLWSHHDSTSRVVWWVLLVGMIIVFYYDDVVKAYQTAPELEADERRGCANLLMGFGIFLGIAIFALSVFAFWL